MSFFFSDETLQNVKPVNNLLVLAKKHGCLVCPLNAKKTSNVPLNIVGPSDAVIYVLSDIYKKLTTEGEELLDKQLTITFGKQYKDITKFASCINCDIPLSYKVTSLEVECCFNKIKDDIEKTKPLVIIGVGNIALKEFCKQPSIEAVRGRKFPIKINTHLCWFFPTHSPDYIIGRRGKYGMSEYDTLFEQDLNIVNTFLNKYTDPLVITEEYDAGIECITTKHPNYINKITEGLQKLQNEKYVACDIETTSLNPYDGNRIISIAISNYEYTIAFEMHVSIFPILENFILSSGKKIFHNCKFDVQWLVVLFGTHIVYLTEYEDTMALAYILDERTAKQKEGPLSLAFLTRLYFGFNIKELTTIDKSNLDSVNIEDTLIYNGRDAKYTYLLFKASYERLDDSQKNSYQSLVDTGKMLCLTQHKGVIIDKNVLLQYQKELSEEASAVLNKINKDPSIVKYTSTYKTFNPASPYDIKKLLINVLNLKLDKKTEKGDTSEENETFSTDSTVLSYYRDQGIQICGYILEYREVARVKSTCIDSIFKLINNDGKLRTQFNHCFTTTGRLNSLEPNFQNMPRRKRKYIRNIIIAPEGHTLVAGDFGQIEPRVVAMFSKDKNFVAKIKQGYDIHKEWTLRLAEIYPKWEASQGKQYLLDNPQKLKLCRDIIKNRFSLPLSYGSSFHSIAKNLAIPEEVAKQIHDEYWKEFADVKNWQKGLFKFYNKYGYVETLFGRRRHAPLKKTEVINSPVQGTAAELTIRAMIRLSKYAIQANLWHFQPILNIHDDITFCLSNETLENDITIIAKEMCSPCFDFINVPLTVEFSLGTKWGELKHYKDYSTYDFNY